MTLCVVRFMMKAFRLAIPQEWVEEMGNTMGQS